MAALIAAAAFTAGYYAAYAPLTGRAAALEAKLQAALDNASLLADRLAQARAEASRLSQRLEKLEAGYAEANRTCAELRRNYTRLLRDYTDLSEHVKALSYEREEFYRQVGDVYLYRGFTLYLYRGGGEATVNVYVPAPQYFRLRLNNTAHTRATIENRFTKDYIRDAVYSYLGPRGAPVRSIAAQLEELSRGDPELYATLALQLVHQLAYTPTLYTKYPLETLVEGSGDCDNLAVLLASIYAAGGYDTLVILVKYSWPNGTAAYHAVTAVALPQPPRDIQRLGLRPAHITLYGEDFYYTEATWGRPGEPGYLPPNTPQAYSYPEAYVGAFTAPPGAEADIVGIVYIRALPGGAG